MAKKTCTKCSKEKPLIEFDRNRRAKDGRSCWCKGCTKEYQHQHRLKNSERVKAYSKKWKGSRCNNKKRSKVINNSKDFIELRKVMGIGA